MKKHPAVFPFSTLHPPNYGRKEENMFTMLSRSLSLSLRKLTAHHKSISAWRKSISRLPLFSDKKKISYSLKKKNKTFRAPVGREEEKWGREGGAGAERGEGGEKGRTRLKENYSSSVWRASLSKWGLARCCSNIQIIQSQFIVLAFRIRTHLVYIRTDPFTYVPSHILTLSDLSRMMDTSGPQAKVLETKWERGSQTLPITVSDPEPVRVHTGMCVCVCTVHFNMWLIVFVRSCCAETMFHLPFVVLI